MFRIDAHVESAVEYTTRATNDTKKALEYQSKARKRIQTRDGLVSILSVLSRVEQRTSFILYIFSKFLLLPVSSLYGSYMENNSNMPYLLKHLSELKLLYLKKMPAYARSKFVLTLPLSSWHWYKGTQKCQLTVKCHDDDITRYSKCLVNQLKAPLQPNFTC